MPAVTEPATLGLRERKRIATRRAIQVATLELLAERGLDGVTVDEISRVADISPRTFFNYFASKEQAMLGDPPELPGGEVIERFVHARGPLLDDLGQVLIAAGDDVMADKDLVHLRHSVVKQYPQLLGMRMVTMRRFEESIAQIIERRLLAEDPAGDRDAVSGRARLVTLVAFAAMRHAWASWADGDPGSRLEDRLEASFRELKHVLASGVGDIG